MNRSRNTSRKRKTTTNENAGNENFLSSPKLQRLKDKPLVSITNNIVQSQLQSEAAQKKPIENTQTAETEITSHDIEDSLRDNESADLKNIKELLANVVSTGVSLCGGEATEMPTSPDIEIKGFGKLDMPLTNKQANKLIDVCEQAPFGFKYRTFVDKKIRDTYQLEPSRVEIKNPEWNKQLDVLVARVCKELGCNGDVSSNLYKMLVYKKGGHFKIHRDTEKESGMFATLIVQLPSRYSGGELVVHEDNGNGGKKQTVFDFGSTTDRATKSIHYACHYADLEHEIRPVLSGYRVVLVYNLTWQGNNNLVDASFLAANNDLISRMAPTLKRFNSVVKIPLAFILNHNYTIKSFETNGIKALKGIDYDRFSVLQNASERLPEDDRLEFYLACMKLSVVYDDNEADCEGRRWLPKGKKKAVSDDDDEENCVYPWDRKKEETNGLLSHDDGDCVPHDSGKQSGKNKPRWSEVKDNREVDIDRKIIKSNGHNNLPYSETSFNISESDLLEVINPNNKNTDEKMELLDIRLWGSDKEHEKSGWTGNEGSTKVTRYNKYILMFWPKCSRFESLCSFDVEEAVKMHVESCEKISRQEFLKNSVILVKKLKMGERYFRNAKLLSDFLVKISETDSLVLVKFFIANLIRDNWMYSDSLEDLGDHLAKLLAKYGWQELEESLNTLLLPISTRQGLLNNCMLAKSLLKVDQEIALKCLKFCVIPALDKENFLVLCKETYGLDDFTYSLVGALDQFKDGGEHMDKLINLITETFEPNCLEHLSRHKLFNTFPKFKSGIGKYRLRWLEEAIQTRSKFTSKMKADLKYSRGIDVKHKPVVDFFASEATEFFYDLIDEKLAKKFKSAHSCCEGEYSPIEYDMPSGYSCIMSVKKNGDSTFGVQITKTKEFHKNRVMAKHVNFLQNELANLKRKMEA